MDSEWKPQILVLGNGGARHLSTLAFLVNLEEQGKLDNLREICCCSTGAIIGLLLACRLEIRRIISIILETDLLDSITEVDLRSLIVQCSTTKSNPIFNEKLKHTLSQVVLEHFGRIPSLNGIFKDTGISLKILSYDIDKHRPLLLDKDNHGEVNCIEAVIYSSNLPGLYRRLYYRGHNLVDGSIYDPYPLSFTTPNYNTLAFFLTFEDQEIYNPLDFHNNIILLKCYNQYLQMVDKYPEVKHVLIKTSNYFDLADKGRILAIGDNRYQEFAKKQKVY